ncbi:MAG: hypothetical protein SPL28_00725 [Bacteroidales bacterium]|nr:hypothetical protein [Bacteroidales bacterium]
MGRIKRYRTALSRHHRSRGFGIHSPFAFNFVCHVLREKHPYYCYDYLEEIRQAVIEQLRNKPGRHPRVISFKGLKMVFRIANHFNPASFLLVGSCYGLTAASMLSVASTSRLCLYEPHLEQFPVIAQVLAPYYESVECYDSLQVATSDYSQALTAGAAAFVLVNSIPQAQDATMLEQYLKSLIDATDCVIIMRNLNRNDGMKRLWGNLKGDMQHGQSFTNEKTGILVMKKKLNLEHFFLWF